MEETLNTIKKRYIHERAIYTWCGIALVAVNPYQEQDIYGEQAVETYHSASHSVYLQLDPHIYAVTEDAYSKLERHVRDQSIIVSGESGAGKTVSAKHAMRYLASIASSKSKRVKIEQRVLASNPIMEAIGNASTVRNDNSSRFGKYIQIFFDRHTRKILGGNMRTYLLEKSRVTKIQPGERNFHIFYQLLNYAHKHPDKMRHLRLLDPDDNFNSLKKFSILSGVRPTETRDDLAKFNEALKTLNIDEKRVDIIYRIIAGILHGGNIEFEPVNAADEDPQGPCTIDLQSFHLNACCHLIGLDPDATRQRLTTKLLKTGAREVITKPLSRTEAAYARDAMLKYIYECLFTWLVGLINLSLSAKEAACSASDTVAPVTPKSPSSKKSILDPASSPQFIGVLDIYGFENFKTNSFEQFCINYANEVLQQQYNQHVFKLEQEEYISEGIDWTFIEYSDNQPVIDLIESRPVGILTLLDEECRMPKGSDTSWCAKLYEQLLNQKTEGVFKRPKMNYQSSFSVCHYAEEVTYDVDTFLEKNRDTICEDQSELLRKSEVINYIFQDPLLPQDPLASAQKARPRPGTRSATVGSQFRASLAALISTLNATEPHYIRCIKPNDTKKAFEFNEERAVQQLKACGVYETIRISNNGFPSRWLYRDFAARYCVLIYGLPVFQQLLSPQSSEVRENGDDDGEMIEEAEEQVNVTIEPQADVPMSRVMRPFAPSEVRPICAAICRVAYEQEIYHHLRTKEEQAYIDGLIERHGNKSSAIYQFGKSKIFFRAGQVGYLERVRGARLRGYTLTIQRHVRGWLARRAYVRLRERFDQEQREASMLSLQLQQQQELLLLQQQQQQLASQASLNSSEDSAQSAGTGYEQRDSSRTPDQPVSRFDSVYRLMLEMVYRSIQPLIIDAVLEYEALDPPEPFASFESRSMSPSEQQPMDELLKELDKFHDLIVKSSVPEDLAVQTFKQLFYLICAQSLNQLLIRRDLCQFGKAMQISFNLSCLIQWCREKYPVDWREIVEQLDPITQATKLLQTRKSSDDIATIEEVCNKLRPAQIIKLLNMYTSSYEEQISTDFIHELEEYLRKTRLPSAPHCEASVFLASQLARSIS